MVLKIGARQLSEYCVTSGFNTETGEKHGGGVNCAIGLPSCEYDSDEDCTYKYDPYGGIDLPGNHFQTGICSISADCCECADAVLPSYKVPTEQELRELRALEKMKLNLAIKKAVRQCSKIFRKLEKSSAAKRIVRNCN